MEGAGGGGQVVDQLSEMARPVERQKVRPITLCDGISSND